MKLRMAGERVAIASAPGKVILFGEHAVVYGRPAIAVPLAQVRATAEVRAASTRGVQLRAQEVGLNQDLDSLPASHALGAVVRATLTELGQDPYSVAIEITIQSTIPVASGLGSGAAVSVAVVRALADWYAGALSPEEVSQLAFAGEKLYHGAPSGVDNTVIAYGLPVYFVKSQGLATFRVPVPFTLVIGDSGVPSPTRESVALVRERWEAERDRFEALFDQSAEITRRARAAIETGEPAMLGPLMDRSQDVLATIGVSSPELETLIEAARRAGALGAKLSGGGCGGNMIAAVEEEMAEPVESALWAAGASQVLRTLVGRKNFETSG